MKKPSVFMWHSLPCCAILEIRNQTKSVKSEERVILSEALSEILAVSAGYFANPV